MLMRLLRGVTSTLLTCAPIGLVFPAYAAEPPAPVGAAPLVRTLDNGLRIAVLEHRTAPVVTVQAWVKAGSTTEGDRTGAGLSHFLEHMLFKGTARRTVGQMGRDVKAIGGYTNAYTSFDRTVYFVNSDAAGVDSALDILTDVLNNATFDPAEIEKEREVIVKEMNRTRDSPSAWTGRLLFMQAFQRHPYRHPVIGYEAILRAVSREDLVAYYQRLYVPNNMALIIVGDIDGPAVLAKAAALWEAIPRAGLADPVRPIEPQQLGPREFVEVRDARLAHVAVGYHGPALASDDLFPMDVLSLILGSGRTSRLYQSVRETQGLVHGISTYSFTPRDPGLFGVQFSCDADKRLAAQAAVYAEIGRVRTDGVDATEVTTAKRKALAAYQFGRETAGQRADSVGTGLILAGDLHFEERYLAGIQAVTAADVQRVARTYLRVTNRTTTSVVPRDETTDTAAAATTGTVREPAVHTLPNGVRVVLRENHSTPLFAMRALVFGGLRSEPADQAGITNLMQLLLPKGTARWDAVALAEVLESRGGAFGTWGGYNSWGVHVRTLAEDWTVGCDVLDQMLLHPTFPEAALERERAAVLAGIRAQDESVQTVARRLMRREMYGAHPYAHLPDGPAEVVERLSVADLRAFHARALDPTRLVIAVSGAVDTAALLARLRAGVGTIGAPATRWEAPTAPTFAAHDGRVVRDPRPTAQTVIMVAFPGVTLSDPRRDALSLMQHALNGQGGRLFQRLRDEAGLAYSVGVIAQPGVDRGLVAFYIATVAERREEALAGLWREIALLREQGLTAQEVADARRGLLSAQAQELETNDTFTFAVGLDELYGLGALFYRGLAERLEAVTPAGTQTIAADLFRQELGLVVEAGAVTD